MRFVVITKKHLLIGVATAVAVVMGLSVGVTAFAKNTRKLPIYSVENDKKQIAISFDAAWGNSDTEELIRILKEHGVTATFFLVGGWIDKYPQSVKQLSEAGFSIQNHSETHPYFTKCDRERIKKEIESCNKKIEAITKVKPTLVRCPYGDYNNTAISTVESLGMYAVQWSVDSKDWMSSATVESIVKNVMSKVTDGSIVLFHNDATFTPKALPLILDQLIAKGYTFVTIEDLILKKDYEIDHTGKQYAVKPEPENK